MEGVAKAAALAGLFMYTLGLLTVNGFLSGYGFTDLSELRTRFVLTGALVIASVCAVLLLILLSMAIPMVFSRGSKWFLFKVEAVSDRPGGRGLMQWISRWLEGYVLMTKVVLWAYCAAIPWVVLYLFLSIGGSPNANELNALQLYLVSVGLGAAAWSLLFFGFSRFSAPPWLRKLERIRETKALLASVISLGVMLCLFVSVPVLFGRFMYPLVPEKFGGGRPQSVQLAFRDTGLEDARQIGITFNGSGSHVSTPVCLLYNGMTPS